MGAKIETIFSPRGKNSPKTGQKEMRGSPSSSADTDAPQQASKEGRSPEERKKMGEENDEKLLAGDMNRAAASSTPRSPPKVDLFSAGLIAVQQQEEDYQYGSSSSISGHGGGDHVINYLAIPSEQVVLAGSELLQKAAPPGSFTAAEKAVGGSAGNMRW